jgi:Fic family protein
MDLIRRKRYKQARNQMIKYVGKPLTHEFIKSIHALIVGDDGQLQYRIGSGSPSIQNSKTGKKSYLPPDSCMIDIQKLMGALIHWYDDPSLTPAEIAGRLHWGIAKIHPFDDGNGRLARILTSYVLLGYGYSEAQCILLEGYFENNRSAYDDVLDDGHIDYQGFDKVSEGWLDYIKLTLVRVQKANMP